MHKSLTNLEAKNLNLNSCLKYFNIQNNHKLKLLHEYKVLN